MEKEIFLSFKPEYFRPILYNIKKYEYRKRFAKEELNAYLYLSSPIKEVIGFIEFGKPMLSKNILDSKLSNENVKIRIKRLIENGENYIIPIKSISLYKKPISLKEIREIDKDFHIPQSYLYIDKYNKLHDYLKRQEKYEKEFYNNHNIIYKDNIGLNCMEMEETLEFKEKDILFRNDIKYRNIKVGYLK